MVAATFGSASWAGDNGKAKGNVFLQTNDGNGQFKLRAAEALGRKNSNQVLDLTPANVCENQIPARRGEILTVC